MVDLRFTIGQRALAHDNLKKKEIKMDEKAFKVRTKKLAIAIIQQTGNLPHTQAADIIGRQRLRAGTSIGANYRAARRAKSTPDMINKLKIVEEEADETQYWIEILTESGIVPAEQMSPIYKKTDELLAMTIASIKTLRNRKS